MEVLRGGALAHFHPDRISDEDTLPVPEHFHDGSLGIRSNLQYTLRRAAGLGMRRSTFWNSPIDVQLLPHRRREAPSSVSVDGHLVPCTIGNVRTQLHNIAVTDGEAGASILEHPNAVQTALGVDMDIRVSTFGDSPLRPVLQRCGLVSRSVSLPTNADCNQPYLVALRDNLVSVGRAHHVTVNEPVGFRFGGGSYILLEPDEGGHKLIVDHQIEYPDIPPLGNQRMRVAMTPEFFSFIAAARTPAMRARAGILSTIRHLGMSRFPYTSLGLSNVVLVTKRGVQNPNEKYVVNGRNYEPMCHELIDRIGWLKFIETEFGGRFVGKITLCRANHDREIEAARALCKGDLLEQGSGVEKFIDVGTLEKAA
ncbi:hypothetical protein A2454_02610 [Candidatus Peribacteria bacterium RIFOXYC2_FULL_55_14]|nr:MAG: UDP-3-O-[3-hydroxymyristoyl] N-acetylglucosamine deacetylase [Candidatus Peribacteria bacterium GW2011_GWC2_54_8]OGJ73702.1 MAG: hypothetical protein A2384_03935 [Candidatus Peribacteria bacterium RIFOXYB1_FULL_54_35]OGJ74830.1 MAG: hypothetical protein A2217_02405 [Candidatus Peribacteria bacterium RIFOXYA2_FULL_55_28]OGJ77118.1 MAG: hypothetical protein A2327_05510 [Candidatus Peribacteria bacterium RIFOXYB2_FULL_54_17]OGJ79772.1 MAG: hypothetical protein A2454_02610 [Candidatus Perib